MRVWKKHGLMRRKTGKGEWKQVMGQRKDGKEEPRRKPWAGPWGIGPDTQRSLDQSERKL